MSWSLSNGLSRSTLEFLEVNHRMQIADSFSFGLFQEGKLLDHLKHVFHEYNHIGAVIHIWFLEHQEEELDLSLKTGGYVIMKENELPKTIVDFLRYDIWF